MSGNLLHRLFVLVTCVFTLLCVAFALTPLSSALPETPVERSDWTDAQGTRYTGSYLPQSEEWLGEVRVEFPDGSLYVGELKGGRFSGHGSYTTPDGQIITGDFTVGRLTG